MEIGQDGLQRFKVPPDRTFIPLSAAMIVIYTIFLFIYFYNNDAIIFFMYTVPLSVVFISLFIFYIFYYSRPVAMSINNEGVVLDLPFKRQRTVKWERINLITVSEGNPDTVIGRMKHDGSITEYHKAPITLTYELAMIVKDEYWKRFGDQVYKMWNHRN